MSVSPDSSRSAAGFRALLAAAGAHYAAGRLADAAATLAQAETAISLAVPAEPTPATTTEQAALWEMKGAVALACGYPVQAVAALRHAAALVPGAAGMQLSLAAALIAAGDRSAAIDALRVAASQAPKQIAINEQLANLLWQVDERDAAIAAFTRVSAAQPDDVATLNRLGMALGVCGRNAAALAVFLQLAAMQPNDAHLARSIAQLLGSLGAMQAARAWFHRALVLHPGEPVCIAALAELPDADSPDLHNAAMADMAVTLAVHALALAPDHPAAYAALGRALLAAGHRDSAIAQWRRSLALQGDQRAVLSALAGALSERGDSAAAEAALRAALKLAPLDAALHARLGDLLKAQWRGVEAATCYRAALALGPAQAPLLFKLADALIMETPSEEAVTLLRQALQLDPKLVDAQAWLGFAELMLRRPEAALAALRPALAVRPDEANWHMAAAAALLAQGDYAAGWPEYAWRWRMPEERLAVRRPADPFVRPDPADWAGRTVLLHYEQGFGDTLQFLRYARLVAARGARVLLEVPVALKSLAAGIPGLDGVFAIGEALPEFDLAVPLMHLPWAFDTQLASIPGTVPYLRADLTRSARFRRRMQGLPGLKVGLVWSGDPRPEMPHYAQIDRRRSITLAELAPLGELRGAVFISLQKGAAAAQASNPPGAMVLHDWTDELEDFAATAALMTALDLIITVDSAPVHLAGALGRPVWMLNRFDSCWRWLQDRDDSPWYPTLRQFRQQKPGDWAGVVADVAAALRTRLA